MEKCELVKTAQRSSKTAQQLFKKKQANVAEHEEVLDERSPIADVKNLSNEV